MKEPTEKMMRAALKVGQDAGLIAPSAKPEDVAVMLMAAMEAMPCHYDGPRYPFHIRNKNGFGIRKARILSVDFQPGYFRIEAEDGATMVIHGNEILPLRQPQQVQRRKGAMK